MNMALEHETECGMRCARCKRDTWECPVLGIACDLGPDMHLCPTCDPNACPECHGSGYHVFYCSRRPRD